MTSPRVLVLDKYSFQRSVVVIALQQLGVSDILQASSGNEAMALMRRDGGVDIALCDQGHSGIDCLDFVRAASQFGMVRAIILYNELQPELHRAVTQMMTVSGLEILGVLSKPIKLESLQKLLSRYNSRCLSLSPVGEPTGDLPSEDDIRRGLALGEFRGWFQPKFMLISGIVAGAEVLARWQHPTRGLLQPKDFLAAVVAYDLIDEMFKQFLDQGLSVLSELHRQGLRLELAFNLHASQLQGNELPEYIQQTLDRYDLPGSCLTFELAENGLLEARTGTHEALRRLRIMGCGLSVDDFGVGFSSLKLLCQLPFTQIKLDGEFVQKLHEPRSTAVIASTLALAKSLSMNLVIEGVSNSEECQALVGMGCELGQGFFFAHPMSAHALMGWLRVSNPSPVWTLDQ